MQSTCRHRRPYTDLKWNHMENAVTLPTPKPDALALLTGWRLGWFRTHDREGQILKNCQHVSALLLYNARSSLSIWIYEMWTVINLISMCVTTLKNYLLPCSFMTSLLSGPAMTQKLNKSHLSTVEKQNALQNKKIR